MSTQNQLSRYGAVSRPIDVPPGAKLFLVSDSDDTTVGPSNLGAEFPADNEGVVRVYNTVQDAVNAASANRGDVILALPGYDQTLGRADSWDKAGVTIMGLGRGTQRATIRYTGKSDEVGISANNIRVTGFRFLAAVDSGVRAVDLDTGFTGIHFDNNVFDFNANGNDFRVMLRVGSERTVIENNRFIAEDTAGAGRAISLKGKGGSFGTIRNNFFYGQYDTVGDTTNGAATIAYDTLDLDSVSGILIHDNYIANTDTAAAVWVRLNGGGSAIRGLATRNIFASFDSSTAGDSLKIFTGRGVGTGVAFVDNLVASADSSTEKRLGDTIIVLS